MVKGRDERVSLLRMDVKYVLRHESRNLKGNKIRVEGIHHDKRYTQEKGGQDPMCQSLQ